MSGIRHGRRGFRGNPQSVVRRDSGDVPEHDGSPRSDLPSSEPARYLIAGNWNPEAAGSDSVLIRFGNFPEDESWAALAARCAALCEARHICSGW